MSDTIDISVIITAHAEGVIAAATAKSAIEAVQDAQQTAGLRSEIILVLDRSTASTRAVLETALGEKAVIIQTDEGDPGQARNRGIDIARGACAAFLDGDDLWSRNWLTEAWKQIERQPRTIAHSACNITFGRESNLWWHIDSEGPFYDPLYLEWANYWDAMSFARTDIYRSHPFRRNDLKLGFGHEDWHFNCATIAAGIAHKPVPRTIHFKRRRSRSQMSLVAQSGSVRWPLDVPDDRSVPA